MYKQGRIGDVIRLINHRLTDESKTNASQKHLYTERHIV